MSTTPTREFLFKCLANRTKFNQCEEDDDDMELCKPFAFISDSTTAGFISSQSGHSDEDGSICSSCESATNNKEQETELELNMNKKAIYSQISDLDQGTNLIEQYSYSPDIKRENELSFTCKAESKLDISVIFQPDELGINRMDNYVYKDIQLLNDDSSGWWVDAVYYDNNNYSNNNIVVDGNSANTENDENNESNDEFDIDFDYDSSFVDYGVLI